MRALTLLLTLCSLPAFAGWRDYGLVNGTFSDVQVLDAGFVLVSSIGTGAELVALVGEADGGVTRVVSLAGAFQGGGYFGNNCLAGVATNVTYSAGCGTAVTLAAAGQGGRQTGNRLSVLMLTGSTYAVGSGPISTGPFTAAGSFTSSTGVRVRSATIGGVDYAVANNVSLANFLLSVDGGTSTQIGSGVVLSELSPFSRSGVPALLGVTSAGALSLQPIINNTMSLAPSLPVGFVARRVAMGTDVGLVNSTTGALASPVPDPSSPTLVWRERPDAGFGVPNVAMHCLDSKWCAVLDSASHLRVYENAAAPLGFVSPVSASAGAVVRFTVDAGDPDGDPLFLSWSGGTAVLGSDGTSVDFTVPLDAGCGTSGVVVTLFDGVHQTQVNADALLGGRGAISSSAPSPSAVYAGGPAVTFDAALDGGCIGATFSWSTTDGQSASGATFSYQPAATWCGGTVDVTLTTTWASGAPATESRTVTLSPTPWGVPNTPSFTSGTQPAGTVQAWLVDPGAEHACSTTGGFPGTELLWDSIDGGGATVTIIDGGLSIDAPACVPGRVVATARRQVIGETLGRVSGPASLDVSITASVPPLDATANFTMSVEVDAGQAVGATALTATCLAQRAVESELRIFDGTTQVTNVRRPLGPFALALPGGCNGAGSIEAELVEDGGLTGAIVRQPLPLPSASPEVGTLATTRVNAVCGRGVSEQLTLIPSPNACASALTSWQLASGPALVAPSGSGTVVAIDTVAKDLSMAGEQLVFNFVADGGAGQLASAQRTIDIGVDPFVQVALITHPLLPREDSSLELEVQLTNTTECDVAGLDLSVPLTGASPLVETVTLDGQRIAATWDSGALTITSLALPAKATGVVRMAARPKLLGTPSGAPSVTLRGLPVSLDAPGHAPAASGCGCAALDATSLLALALVTLARRRRHLGVRSSPAR